MPAAPSDLIVVAPPPTGHFVEVGAGTPDLNVPTPDDDANATAGDVANGIDPTQAPLPTALPALGSSEAASAVVTEVTGAD